MQIDSSSNGRTRIGLTAALSLAMTAALASAQTAEWPQWRGPAGNGSSQAKGLPSTWDVSTGKNVLWTSPLTGHAAATPVVAGDRIFLVDAEGADVFARCLSLKDGSRLWAQKIGSGNKPWGPTRQNNMGTPSPCTDGKHVWFMTAGWKGEGGDLYCFDLEGKQVWKKNLQQGYGKWTHDFGSGSTPLLHKGVLYVPVLHRPESYVIALDAATGAEKWKTVRPTPAEDESRDGYGSPVIAVREDGKADVVIVGADLATAYDAETGKETWRADGLNPRKDRTLRIIVTPVVADGYVFVFTAKSSPIFAVRVGSGGEVTADKRFWTLEKETPDRATPAAAGGLLFIGRETGVALCVDAKDGKVLWRRRMPAVGDVKASPLVADGKAYFVNEKGVVMVMASSGTETEVAVNKFPDGHKVYASPVALEGKLLFRTDKALYCLGEKKP